MEMDWGTAIVGVVSIFICIVPFAVIYYSRVKKENKMMQLLSILAEQNDCKVGKYEFCGDFLMGLDEKSNFIFFVKQNREINSQYVDLSEIYKCRVDIKSRDVKNPSSTLYSTQRIELSFLPSSKRKEVTKFELYDVDSKMQLNGELQFVEKWSKQINDRLKKN